MWAIYMCSLDSAELLLRAGADKERVGRMFYSPTNAVEIAVEHDGRTGSVEARSLLRRYYVKDLLPLVSATHARIGAVSPASLLRGFPLLTRFIIGISIPWQLWTGEPLLY